jgi:hypothetical protein
VVGEVGSERRRKWARQGSHKKGRKEEERRVGSFVTLRMSNWDGRETGSRKERKIYIFIHLTSSCVVSFLLCVFLDETTRKKLFFPVLRLTSCCES